MTLIGLALACTGDFGLGKEGQNDPAPSGVIEVWPGQIFFEAVPVGTVVEGEIQVRNVGDALLDVSAHYVDGDGFLAPDFSAHVLDPGASFSFDVQFTPTSDTHDAVLWVVSNDAANPEVPVQLGGTGVYPKLEITPSPYDFGQHGVGCSNTNTFTLANTGDAPLIVDSLETVGATYAIATPVLLPLTLEIGATTELEVTYTADDVGVDLGALRATSNDPGGPDEVSFTGEGFVEPVVDEFLQGTYNRVDLVLTVDRSGSMDQDLRHVGENAPVLLDILSGIDFQLSIVTDDNGCANAIITPDTPDAAGVMADALLGRWGRWTEAGFTLGLNALAEANGGCNDGMRRDDAHLELLHISDEPEQSEFPWTDYVIDVMLEDPTVRVSAVAGPVPGGCERADAGVGYYDAVAATGGMFVDFCFEDWAEPLAAIADGVTTAPTRGDFRLTRVPYDPAGIEVTVDGIVATSWTYVPGPNAVEFDADAWPGNGAVIVVTYTGIPECDP